MNDHWREGQTVGLGFIALAALILSNWNPKRLILAALLFGFAQAIPYWLNDAPIIRLLPPEFIRMIPYVVTDRGDRWVRREGPTSGRGREGLRGWHRDMTPGRH